MKSPNRLVSVLSVLSLMPLSLVSASRAQAEESQRWSKNPGWAQGTGDIQTPERQVKAPVHDQVEYRSKITPFSPGSNNLSLDVGQVFLFGDLGNGYSDAIGFRLHNVYAVSDMFGLDTSLEYSSHGPASTDGNFSISNLNFGLRTNVAWIDKAIPYVTFGLGFFRPAYGQPDGSTLDAVLFGLQMGGGINLEVSKALFFGASLNFHDMFGTKKRNSSGALQDVDGSFASFLVSAGVSF